jgi:type IV pilus assembly protein PilV
MQQPLMPAIAHRTQCGWGLMEALAALSLLSLGILGLLWAQGKSVLMWRSQQASEHAAWLVQDMAERVRVNRTRMNAYQLSWGQKPVAMDCSNRPCSTQEWAMADLSAWTQEVQIRMPGAQTQVWVSPSDAQHLGIALAWREAGQVATDLAAQAPGLNCPAQHRCYFLHVRP